MSVESTMEAIERIIKIPYLKKLEITFTRPNDDDFSGKVSKEVNIIIDDNEYLKKNLSIFIRLHQKELEQIIAKYLN